MIKKDKKPKLGGASIGLQITDKQLTFLNDYCIKNTLSYSTVIRTLINELMEREGGFVQ